MSTKTISKRVALATVVALGAGVLSLVSVTSASALPGYTANDATTYNVDPVIGATNPTTTAGTLSIASKLPAIGTVTATASATTASNISYGLLAVSDIAGGFSGSLSNVKTTVYVPGTTQTATLIANGTLTVFSSTAAIAGTATSNDAANQVAVVKVTGGTITGVAQDSGTLAYNASLTAAAMTVTAGGNVAWKIAPNAGVSVMTVQMYNGSAASSSSTYGAVYTAGAAAQAAANSPASGTLNGQITVSVAASSVAGTLSLTKSGIFYSTGSAAATSDITSPLTGQPAVGTSAWNVPQYASLVLKDAYGTALSSGVLTATATNGAYVSLANSATAPSAGTSSTAFVSGTNGASLTVAPSVSTASNTTVTLSYNGTVIGTKAFTFNGQVAKVVLSAAGNGKIGGTASNITNASTNMGNTVSVTFKDSAGTTLYIGAASQTGSYPLAVTKNAGQTAFIGGIGTPQFPSAAAPSGTSTNAGLIPYTCTNPLGGTGSLAVDYTNIDGTVVTSNTVSVNCSAIAANYTAKLDKATYNPGDIAVLTVTFKDATGSLAADIYTQSTASGVTTVDANSSAISSAALPVAISGSNLTTTGGATSYAGTTDVTTNGVATYKFIVGTPASGAAFNGQLVVDFPKVDAVLGQTGLNVPYTIAAAGGTSLNDVLKGIVSLIASINKQIAALAKLVAKK